MRIVAIDHVQLAMPAGGEVVALREDAGYRVEHDVPLPGVVRAHVADPFGNRIELVEMHDLLP